MNILFVTARPLEINSSSTIRNRAYIDGLLQLGINIDVLSIDPDNGHNRYESLNDSLKNRIRNIRINSGKFGIIKSLGRRNFFFKYFRKIGYKIFAYFSIYETTNEVLENVLDLNIAINKFDLIISSSDPKSSHELALILIKNEINNIPWIQIWGDPFYSDISRKNKLLDNKIKNKENDLLCAATKIIYVSPLTLDSQRNIFPDFSNKMSYIPTPYLEKKIFNKKSHSNQLNFLYLGDYNSNIRNIIPIYTAFSKSNHHINIYGDSDLNLKETKNTTIKNRVDYAETLRLIENSDILIHLSNLKGNQIPGKIFHYSATNKPILFILDGDKNKISKEFEKYNRYMFCDNDTNSIKNAIDEIYKNFNDYNFEPLDDFSSVNCVKKIIDINF